MRARGIRLLSRSELFPSPGPVRVILNGKEKFNGALPEDCLELQESWHLTGDPFLAHSAEVVLSLP